MVQSERNLTGPSIEAMLRGLTERPNVQYTLILSRRDGSIIRATGVAGSTRPNTSSSTSTTGVGTGETPYAQYPRTPTPQRPIEGGADSPGQSTAEATDTTTQVRQPEPVELLASSIFQFVSNADVLSVTLGSVSRGTAGAEGSGPTLHSGGVSSGETARQDPAEQEEESEQTRGEDDVQLLRLRTKHQEIIIFPDSKYICCVVQRMGKAAAGASARR